MPERDIVVIGASAGGLEAVSCVIASLSSQLKAAFFIVIHSAPEGPALLAEILARLRTLPVMVARDGERIKQTIADLKSKSN